MIKFEPNGNIFHIGADELAVMACPCGDILQRSGYAQHRTPEGMKAVRELRRSSSDKCERSPIITDSVKLCGIEIVDYENAQKSLRFSVNCDKVYNPTCTDVWFTVNGETVCCKAGQGMTL